MTALLDNTYVPTSIHQELHSGAGGTLAKAQDVGARAQVFRIDGHLMQAFAKLADILAHHHATGHVKHLIAHIGVAFKVEADGSLV